VLHRQRAAIASPASQASTRCEPVTELGTRVRVFPREIALQLPDPFPRLAVWQAAVLAPWPRGG